MKTSLLTRYARAVEGCLAIMRENTLVPTIQNIRTGISILSKNLDPKNEAHSIAIEKVCLASDNLKMLEKSSYNAQFAMTEALNSLALIERDEMNGKKPGGD